MQLNRKKLLYALLKEISEGKQQLSHADFQLTEDELHEITSLATTEGYLSSVQWYDNQPHFHLARITMKGLDYLEENSLLAKTYRGLKDIISFLK
jgi:hypothetical protein